jgi:hypothetical protein
MLGGVIMNTHDQERARAIQLLHTLIERSPSDARNRARLLSLLYVNGNQGQFVFEAKKYKECCDLSFDADWVSICDMGLELDPDNNMFHVSATRPDAGNSDHKTSKERAVQKEQRTGSERRKQDRRTSFTAWFGTENREFSRRQKYRRQADVDIYKKR